MLPVYIKSNSTLPSRYLRQECCDSLLSHDGPFLHSPSLSHLFRFLSNRNGPSQVVLTQTSANETTFSEARRGEAACQNENRMACPQPQVLEPTGKVLCHIQNTLAGVRSSFSPVAVSLPRRMRLTPHSCNSEDDTPSSKVHALIESMARTHFLGQPWQTCNGTRSICPFSVTRSNLLTSRSTSSLSFYLEPVMYWEAPESQHYIWASKN